MLRSNSMNILPLNLILFSVSLFASLAAAAQTGSCPPSSGSWDDMLKAAALHFAGTFETLLRSFALGFGAHMLQYMLWTNKDCSFEDIKRRFPISAVCGLVMGSFVFGASFLLPTNFRTHWLDYE